MRTTVRSHLTPARTAEIIKQQTTTVRLWRRKTFSMRCFRNANWCSLCGNQCEESSKHWKLNLSCDPAIPVVSLGPDDWIIPQIPAQNLHCCPSHNSQGMDTTECLSTDEQIMKMWHRCVCHAQLLPSLPNHNAIVSVGLEVPCSSTTPSFTFSFYPALYFSLRKVLARTCHSVTKYWGHLFNS